MDGTEKENITEQFSADSRELTAGTELAELSRIISSQIVQIKDLGEKIESAINTANNAKMSADHAKIKSVKLGHKAEAITALQSATVDLAQAQSDTADALKHSFEYEKKLGDIAKYLFALGAYSASNTQFVIQRLSEELKAEGEGEKISEVAKEQLITVIRQLKAQEEVMNRQVILDDEIKELNGRIDELERKIAATDRLLGNRVWKTAVSIVAGAALS